MFTSMLTRETAGRTLEESAAGVIAMDEETFREFYELTARPLWIYLSRMSRDPQLADDILQETYYRFCRSGSTYESDSHRRNALFHIATNLLRDHARRRRGILHVALDDVSGAQIGTTNSGERADRRMDLARAMATLEPRQREMLWLAYAEGESHAEIAKICGVREPSVRTILLRARRKMAKMLRNSAAGGDER